MWEPQPLPNLRASTACTGITLSFSLHITRSSKTKILKCYGSKEESTVSKDILLQAALVPKVRKEEQTQRSPQPGGASPFNLPDCNTYTLCTYSPPAALTNPVVHIKILCDGIMTARVKNTCSQRNSLNRGRTNWSSPVSCKSNWQLECWINWQFHYRH
jgi:hypothetical protein